MSVFADAVINNAALTEGLAAWTLAAATARYMLCTYSGSLAAGERHRKPPPSSSPHCGSPLPPGLPGASGDITAAVSHRTSESDSGMRRGGNLHPTNALTCRLPGAVANAET
jgi:hypothetical protein